MLADGNDDDSIQLQCENERLGRDNALLQTDNKRLADDNGRLAEDSRRLQTDNKRLADDNGRLAEDIRRLQADNEKLSVENARLAADNQLLQAGNKQLSQDMQLLVRQGQQRDDDVVQRLTGVVVDMQREFKQRCAALRDQVETLLASMADMQEETHRLSRMLVAAEIKYMRLSHVYEVCVQTNHCEKIWLRQYAFRLESAMRDSPWAHLYDAKVLSTSYHHVQCGCVHVRIHAQKQCSKHATARHVGM